MARNAARRWQHAVVASFSPQDRDGLAAGAVAGVAQLLPSTLHALATGADPLATLRAAGSLLLPESASSRQLAAAGVVAHTAVALNWGVVMSRFLDRRRPVSHGLGAGVALFAFQYGLFGRCFPRIRALPAPAQLADHAAYGAAAGAALRALRARRADGS